MVWSQDKGAPLDLVHLASSTDHRRGHSLAGNLRSVDCRVCGVLVLGMGDNGGGGLLLPMGRGADGTLHGSRLGVGGPSSGCCLGGGDTASVRGLEWEMPGCHCA